MDTLLNPDIGLTLWTIITFAALVVILKKFAWGPLLRAVHEREERLGAERKAAEDARAEAERIRLDLQTQLAAIDAKAHEALARATKDIQALRSSESAKSQEEARRLIEKTRAELEEEKRRLVAQLRGEVGRLAVSAAEKLMEKSVDGKVRDAAMERFFHDLEKPGAGKK